MKPPVSSPEPLEARIAPATFVVTNLTDDGTLNSHSLRDAINQANDQVAHPGLDKIIFKLPAPPPFGVNTIVVGSELLITDSISIAGPGAGKLIIDGALATRVFHIDDGTTADKPASITGLSITGGQTTTSGGAGILSAESLTLKNVTVSGCTTTGGTAIGGGVRVEAAAAGSFVSVSHCAFTENSAAVVGGDLALRAVKSIAVTGSVLLESRGDNGGGGLYATLGSDAAGTATITLIGDLVAGNYGLIGGGLSIDTSGAPTTTKVTVSHCEIVGNFGTLGAGLFLGGGNGVVTGSTIRGNSAKQDGGGIYAGTFQSFTLSASTVSGNETTSTSGVYPGGGVFLSGGAQNGVAKISHSKITDNKAAGGGGIYAQDGMSLLVSGCTISGNNSVATTASAGGGGGICVAGSGLAKVNLTITGSTISDNHETSGSGFGGGLRVIGDSSLTLTASKVTGNQGRMGGGMYLGTTGAVKLTAVTCTNNSASEYGGGAYLKNLANFTISGGRFAGNSAINGGAVEVKDSTGTIVSILIGNLAFGEGGGIYQLGTPISIHAATITGNVAPFDVNHPASANLYGAFTYI